MKIIRLSLVLVLFCSAASGTLAQTTKAPETAPTQPPFKRFPTIPPLDLTSADGQKITKESLKKHPTLIMYFSPSCEHCIAEMNEIKKRWADFDHLQVVMATYQPMEELKQFITDYEMDKHPNFLLGRDEKFLLPPFFVMKSLPYLALYNKKGNLITTFEGTTKLDKVLAAFKN